MPDAFSFVHTGGTTSIIEQVHYVKPGVWFELVGLPRKFPNEILPVIYVGVIG